MKKIIPIVILLISCSVFAQIDGETREHIGEIRERIKAQKVAFITERLSLTVEEAQSFWPIYNAYESKTEKIRSEDLRAIKIKMRKNPELSEQEANDLLTRLIKAEDAMHAAKQELVKDLKTVISSEKIIKLKAAEDEFNKKLLERLKEYRNKRGNRD
jgi:hypothetical protein